MADFERIVEFDPAYDMRDKGCGIHCCNLRMILKNEKGAVQFVLFTGWHLPEVLEDKKSDPGFWRLLRPMPSDLGYHSPVPQYDGQEPNQEECPYLDGKPCYYDGSALNAEEVFNILLKGGHGAVWEFLEEYHREIFSEGKEGK